MTLLIVLLNTYMSLCVFWFLEMSNFDSTKSLTIIILLISQPIKIKTKDSYNNKIEMQELKQFLC